MVALRTWLTIPGPHTVSSTGCTLWLQIKFTPTSVGGNYHTLLTISRPRATVQCQHTSYSYHNVQHDSVQIKRYSVQHTLQIRWVLSHTPNPVRTFRHRWVLPVVVAPHIAHIVHGIIFIAKTLGATINYTINMIMAVHGRKHLKLPKNKTINVIMTVHRRIHRIYQE